MRVLLVTLASRSHLALITPIARAVVAAGHEVRVATHPDGAQWAVSLGFPTSTVGSALDLPGIVRRLHDGGFGQSAGSDLGLTSSGGEGTAEASALRRAAFGYATFVLEPLSDDRFLADLLDLMSAERPDLVIWDGATHAGWIAAEMAGIPHVRSVFGVEVFHRLAARTAQFDRQDPVQAWVRRRSRDAGREVGPSLADTPAISLVPPQFQYPDVECLPYGSAPAVGGVLLPDWLTRRRERPRVCLTLGTYAAESSLGSGQLRPLEIVERLLATGVEVVATLSGGCQRPPEHDRLRIVDFMPLQELLPRCDVVVHHLGMGTVISAARAGVPQVRVPDGSDLWGESWLAGTMREHGWLQDASEAPDLWQGIADGVEKALGESVRRAAGELQEAVCALPPPSRLVGDLERIAGGASA